MEHLSLEPNPIANEHFIYDDLIDIRTCKRKEKASRAENAEFLIEQLKSHKLFKVGDDVVEIGFAETDKSLTQALTNHFRQQASK